MVTAKALCVHEGGKSSTSIGKLILLFTGKVPLSAALPGRATCGRTGLLLFGVAFRAMGSRLVSSVSPARQGRPTTRGEDWRALWTARNQWRRGWPGSAPPFTS